jgi:hypothetical protein
MATQAIAPRYVNKARVSKDWAALIQSIENIQIIYL